MRKFCTACLLSLILAAIPLEASAQEIHIPEEKVDVHPGSYTVMVTAGTVGVAASASLLILSNRRR